MADEQTESRVETSWTNDDRVLSVEGDKVSNHETAALEIDRNAQNEVEGHTDDDADAGGTDGDRESPSPGSDGGDADKGADAEGGEDAQDFSSLTDIDAYDPDNAENVAAWDKEYTTEAGELNMDRLGLEIDRNKSKEGGTPVLNEATYAFLGKKYGLPRSVIDGQIAMRENAYAYQKAQAKADDLKLFDVAGGPERLSAAKEWAKNGGLTEAQMKRHEEALRNTDFDVRSEAVELLMTRFDKVNPKAEERRTEPKRDATQGQGKPSTSTVVPFKNKAEWRAARKEAGNNVAALRAVDARYKASKFTED